MFTASNAQPKAHPGPDIDDVQTEAVGFLKIHGDTTIRLLPSPWPKDDLPKPTSSLFSIASRAGLAAAAGPDVLVICSTDKLRDAYSANVPEENKVKQYTPELSIPVPRVSHLAFTSDEKYLVICADQGGGLAIYDVQALLQGNTQSSFQIGTEGIGIRALIPNPSEQTAHILALVLDDGKLMLANLTDRNFVKTQNGLVLQDGVSCVSWSAKGKQLLAGLGNASALQLSPDGTVVAEIPRPPQIQQNYHISSLLWLANDSFLLIYTPNSFDPESAPESTFILATREPKTTNFVFQKSPDSCPPFGMNRSPPHHFITRLREWPPNLSDLLLVSSTASGDVGIITNSKSPLTSDPSAANTAGIYTGIVLANDAQRAQLPTTDEMLDTSPIGTALDLSSKSRVKRPIPTEEMDESSTPLPAYMILNNDGILSTWWFVYSDSVRQAQPFPGLVAAPKQPGFQATTQSFVAKTTPSVFGSPVASTSAFGSTAFGGAAKPSPFSTSPTSTFGKPAAAAAAAPVFGQSSTPAVGLGAVPAFGQSAIPAFGQRPALGGMGKPVSPWSTPNAPASLPVADKPNPFGAGGSSTASPFGQVAKSSTTQTPFGGAASPFGSVGGQTQSAFAATKTQTSGVPGLSVQPSFGSTVTLDSSFGSTSAFGKSAFNTPSLSNKTSDGLFGKSSTNETQRDADMDNEMDSGDTASEVPTITKANESLASTSSTFQIKSAFGNDNKQKEEPAKPDGNNLFGSAFQSALGAAAKTSDPVIKKEPVESPPLSSFSPNKPVTEPEVSESEPPLPPSPTSQKELYKTIPHDQLPSLPTTETKQAPKESLVEPDAPLPPSPTFNAKQPDPATLPSLDAQQPGDVSPTQHSAAGSSPVDLGADRTSSASEDGEITETPRKSLADQAKAALPVSAPPAFNWPSPKTPAKPEDKPNLATVILPPPSETPDGSPRSPSPIRQSRGPGPSPLRNQRDASNTPKVSPPKVSFQNSTSRVSVPSLAAVNNSRSRSSSPPSPEEREIYESDGEAEAVREELAQPIVASKKLAPFVAHQDYTGNVTGHGLGAQLERLYRDIDSMIDTLGLNARTLASFIKGHDELYYEGEQRDRSHLENEDDWALIELEDLAMVQKGLSEHLDAERPQDIRQKLLTLRDIDRSMNRLRRVRQADLQRLIDEQAGRSPHTHSASLTAEQSHSLRTMRSNFAHVQTQLSALESGSSQLRALLASASSARDTAVPTVEAIINTIAKMTRMAESKRSDVDVLEAQLRRLRAQKTAQRTSASIDDLDMSAMNLNGSAPATPTKAPSNGKSVSTFKAPGNDSDDEDEDAYEEAYATPEGASDGALLSAEARDVFAARQARKKKVIGLLREKILEKGTRMHRGRGKS